MKHLLALFVALLSMAGAHAQSTDTPYKKIAVTSLIGDVITVDVYRKRVGTMIDTNLQEKVPVSPPIFDEAGLR